MPFVDTVMELGTLSVETYERPPWLFNKVLYCEKEGLFPGLRHSKFPERHDCALLSSKGFASRATAQLIEKLSRCTESIEVFCIHDADGPGTKIYEALAREVEIQRATNVEVINLGLEPEEALAMNLQVEEFTMRKKRVAVGEYIEEEYREWLQTHRVELNAMSPTQLVTWLDRKMAQHASGKLLPPEPVLAEELEDNVHRLVRHNVERRILESANADRQVEAAIAALADDIEENRPNLTSAVNTANEDNCARPWRDVLQDLAESLVDPSGE